MSLVLLLFSVVLTMITRRDVSHVLNAFANQEWCYWQENDREWMLFATHPLMVKKLKNPDYHVDPAVLWDGFHWHYTRCLIRAQLWEDLKRCIERMQETHLREWMQTLIHSTSPRVYQELWGEYD